MKKRKRKQRVVGPIIVELKMSNVVITRKQIASEKGPSKTNNWFQSFQNLKNSKLKLCKHWKSYDLLSPITAWTNSNILKHFQGPQHFLRANSLPIPKNGVTKLVERSSWSPTGLSSSTFTDSQIRNMVKTFFFFLICLDQFRFSNSYVYVFFKIYFWLILVFHIYIEENPIGFWSQELLRFVWIGLRGKMPLGKIFSQVYNKPLKLLVRIPLLMLFWSVV